MNRDQSTNSVYAQRLRRASQLAAQAGLQGLIFGTGPELAYFLNSWVSTHERLTVLVIPAAGSQLTPRIVIPAVDVGDLRDSAVPDVEELGGIEVVGWEDGDAPHSLAVSGLAQDSRPVGLGRHLTADHVLEIQRILGSDTDTVLASNVLAAELIAKDDAEIAELEAAGAAIDSVFERVPELLRAGRTERDVAAEIEKLILSAGHSAVDFIIVGSGENGSHPHHSFSDRVLEVGDIVVVDLGGAWGSGYHSDCTRTFVVQAQDLSDDPAHTHQATLEALRSKHPDFEDAYEVLHRAQLAALAAVRPGVQAQDIDRIARDIISEGGFGEHFVHRTGHGIGLSTHEEPFIMAGNTLPLEAGMCFSIEPGIYIPGKWGARIEDIVVVTAEGCRTFNNTPKNLFGDD